MLLDYDLELEKLVQESVYENCLMNEETLKYLAAKIGKPYKTLCRELDPFDHRAKLGLITAMKIARETHNIVMINGILDYTGFSNRRRAF